MAIGFFDVALKELDRYEARREKELARRPKCISCGEYIQDDYLFDLGGGDVYCAECLVSEFRRSTEDYTDD